jgi:single-stranded-DNA-specific exonuclease
MQKRWKLLPCNADAIDALHETLKINKTLCKILVQRGFDTYDKTKNFFRPQLSDLHDPYLMKDMDKAVTRIIEAFEQHEKIMVYGDYDVDGTTSVASMYQFIAELYDQVIYYIPHREREGYGISQVGIEYAFSKGVTLIISLDCGIKSVDLVAYAKTRQIDFVICDHHMPDKEVPAAVAILNPKQTDCNYPFKELCGCGVGFKLMTALANKLFLPAESYLKYMDMLATAIAADIVSITGENRVMAYFGVKQVNENPSVGIKALMKLAKVEKEMHINNLVFIIAPRINAAGRMDDAKKAVQLFIEKDEIRAMELAEILHSDNTDRREADASITEEALAMIESDEKLKNQKSTVVYQPHWHKGVVGIVASRLIDTYYRPTVVLTKSGAIAAGSARSVVGFNLYEAIHACREHLVGYGGHFAAAGMTLLPENVQAFSNAFEQVVKNSVTPEMLVPEIVIDAEVKFSEINIGFYNILQQMEPYGPDNMRPYFLAKNVVDTGYSKIVKDQHIKFSLKQDDFVMSGIGFNMAQHFPLLENKKPVDVIFSLDLNEWNGTKSLQIKVCDIRLSEIAVPA